MALRTYSNEDYQVAKLAAQALGVELSQEVYLDEKTARSYKLLKVGTYYWASIAHECSAFYEALGYEKPIPLTACRLAEVLGTTAYFQTWYDHGGKAYESLMVGPFPWADIADVFGKEYLDEGAIDGKYNTLSVEARQALVGPVGVCKQLELLEHLRSYGLNAKKDSPCVLCNMLFEAMGYHYGAFIQKCLVCQAIHPLDDVTCKSLGSCPYESLSFASFLRSLEKNSARLDSPSEENSADKCSPKGDIGGSNILESDACDGNSLKEDAADFDSLEGNAGDFDSLKDDVTSVHSFEDNSTNTDFLKDNATDFDSLEGSVTDFDSFEEAVTGGGFLEKNVAANNVHSLEKSTTCVHSFKPQPTESCPREGDSVVFAWKKHVGVTPRVRNIPQIPHLPVKRAIHHARDNPPKGGDATPPNA